jgi:cytochrome c553
MTKIKISLSLAPVLATALAAGLTSATAALAQAPAAPAGDPNAGREKTAMCAGCHGIDGWRTAYPEVYTVPRLGGQSANYIVSALQAYKSGARNHPSMKAIAASLTDKDIADLAAFYSSNTPAQHVGKAEK